MIQRLRKEERSNNPFHIFFPCFIDYHLLCLGPKRTLHNDTFAWAWMMHPGFKTVVELSWRSQEQPLPEKIENLNTALAKWSKDHLFRKHFLEKEITLDQTGRNPKIIGFSSKTLERKLQKEL